MSGAVAVPVASWLLDWKAAWKAITSGPMNPTKMWKSSQLLIEPFPARMRDRLRTG